MRLSFDAGMGDGTVKSVTLTLPRPVTCEQFAVAAERAGLSFRITGEAILGFSAEGVPSAARFFSIERRMISRPVPRRFLWWRWTAHEEFPDPASPTLVGEIVGWFPGGAQDRIEVGCGVITGCDGYSAWYRDDPAAMSEALRRIVGELRGPS